MNPIRLFFAQAGRCFHCGEEMLLRAAISSNKHDRGYTREHVIPVSKGGGERHVVLAHRPCNTKRGNAAADEAMLSRMAEIRARAEQVTMEAAHRSLSNGGKANATRASFKREWKRPLSFDPPRLQTRFDAPYSAADAAQSYIDG